MMRKSYIKVSAIVPSAGKGRRFKSRVPKPYIDLGGKPILARTLLVLSRNKRVSEILVAVERNKVNEVMRGIIYRYKIKKARVVIGGKERGDSVYNALKKVSPDAGYVLIHDGIRPFITDDLIRISLAAAIKHGASVAAVPLKPTLKFSKKGKFVEYTPQRGDYWEAQTPQVFKRGLIEKAYELARRKNIKATDDAMLVERLGVKPRIVMGSYSNIKITTREDLELAKALLRS
ncbi:MAG: 2-C-methyl-D-erythritol 4-phosphate cytidylyltransferase [Candidatus Omnitrophota bacterium]